tara:strand:+ start:325 stop:819 length:495 start_codon:yes stop_codon:yes gene_type:complete
MALTKLNTSSLPAGSVLQVVDSGELSGSISNQTTSFVDTRVVDIAITPKFITSKIMLTVTQNLQVWNTSNYATGRWRIMRNINNGSYSVIYEDSNSSNGNVFAYDYGGSGINILHPISYTMIDSPSTTNEVKYKTQIAMGANGGNRISSEVQAPSRMVLMEIAG